MPREVRSPGRRRLSRPARLTLGFLAASASVGLLASLYAWLTLEPDIGAPRPAVVLAGVGVAVGTMANLLLRFLRWQYLLRRFGVRVAAPASLGAFVGSFAFLPIPLYVGQLIARARLVTDVGAAQRGYLLLAFLWERVLDLWALAALYAALAAAPIPGLAAGALVLVPGVRRTLMGVARAGAGYLSRLFFEAPVVLERDVTEHAARGSVFTVSALLSVAAWTVVVVSIVPLATMAGVTAGVAAEGAAAARSILVGAVSLVPLGFGVSGLTLAGDLGALTADPVASAHVTLIFRAATAWLTVGIGAVALVALRRWREREATHDHFDAIDECYDTWLPVHFRAHVVAKKTEPMIVRLGGRLPGARGLDIGCGRGWYLRALRDGGALMTGLDTSALQLEAAREYVGPEAPLVRATMLSLPFAAKSFEFAYVINVLHHLPPERQLEALGQVASVVSPGGLVFVHEMNPINPLFRFYLGYVFPILKGIEEGVETYLDPRQIENVPGLELTALHYFSFMPDFVPARLLGVLTPMERRLERSLLARFSAHFLAIYTRTTTP